MIPLLLLAFACALKGTHSSPALAAHNLAPGQSNELCLFVVDILDQTVINAEISLPATAASNDAMVDDVAHSRRPRASGAPPADLIVFPDNYPSNQQTISQCGNNQTFCDDESDYPLAAIEALIGRDANRYKGVFDTEQEVAISTRMRDDDAAGLNETPMCDHVIETTWPKKSQTEDNTWAYIVNTEKYKQGVRIERCKSKAQQCNFANNFPNKMRAQCHQVFTTQKLFAIKDATSPIETKIFKFPSCCQCRVSTHA